MREVASGCFRVKLKSILLFAEQQSGAQSLVQAKNKLRSRAGNLQSLGGTLL